LSKYRGCWLPFFATALVVTLLTSWAFGLGTPDAFNFPRPFNAAKWKSANTWGDTRCGMVADLRHRIGLIGKSRTKIEAMLGKPEEQNSNDQLSVYLLCPSLADIFILELRWKNDQVVSVNVRDT
jgi:hypothetical protein